MRTGPVYYRGHGNEGVLNGFPDLVGFGGLHGGMGPNNGDSNGKDIGQ